MPRVGVNPLQVTEELRPVASPVDTYVQPAPSRLTEFATSLSKIAPELETFLTDRADKQKKDDLIRGQAAFYGENSESIAEGVRTGQIPPQYSPAFMKGFKQTQGDVAGVNLSRQFDADFQAWEGKNSDDPAVYDEWIKNWVKDKAGTEDPDVLKGLLPHVREIVTQGSAKYTTYRAKQVYNGALDANLAAANQVIDAENQEGLSSEKGTNYAKVFASIAEKRAAFVATGGNPDDFDKQMVDAMSNKIIETRDPGLLGWFDQKVPGKDYTYGESPYGAQIKQNTVANLEVVSRTATSQEAAAQKAKDEKLKDEGQRAIQEQLAADPSAPIDEKTLQEISKVDPTIRTKVVEWREALNKGFTDTKAEKHVYDEIMAGRGKKAIQQAMGAGVFGKAEDLTKAYAFQKSYEDNADKIKESLSSPTADDILKTIDIRTKAVNDFGDPLSGSSNEGLEAKFDFRRKMQEWIIANPDATSFERDEQASKIGKQILDRIPIQEDAGLPGSEAAPYNRDAAETFDNPYTDGTAPIEAGPNVGGPEKPEDSAYRQLDPSQKENIDAQAKAAGKEPKVYLKELMDKAGIKAQPISYDPDDPDLGDNDIRENGFTPEQAESFLDEALSASKQTEGGDAATGQVPALKQLIKQHEAAGNYNAVYGNAKSTRDLGEFTLDQILAFQQDARRRGAKSTAIGGYQFIYKTLRGLKDEAGLSGSEKFTPELQDKLADVLLERRGLSAYLNGKISKRQFAYRLSQEWASLPNPNTGRSYYAGDGLNASGTSAKSVYEAMNLVVPASYSPAPTKAGSGVPAAYAKIPDVDDSGQAGQQAKFMEWNSDPIANHEKNLASIEPQLAEVIRNAQKKTGVKFVVGSGKRDASLQKKAKEWGWSKTEDSDHLHGGAVDLWPVDADGAVDFTPKQQKEIIKAMKASAKELGVELDVGGEWKSFKDLPHFALKQKKTKTT